MYEELIRRLREEPLDSNKAALPIMDLCIDAATAIENLSHRLDMAQGERDAVTRHMIELEQEVCRLKSRLAAYEDTGLEPEEITDFMKRWERSVEIAGLCKKGGIGHLLELKKAEQDGRLLVLPCKVGDTVYAAETGPVIPLSVAYVGVYLEGADGGDWEALDNIGETVFLTREEAEAALAGKGSDG